eukprot:TRINITY_DN2891_c0_g1_i2.p7 TRINITY_DN2891_c0_g1~~TRINITY_DN2891_c0_g1_i2.p7  ORF type:complete len:108 (+),score=3.42 TRINITY_DN2891_c0_g1_i2:839-1162(+)
MYMHQYIYMHLYQYKKGNTLGIKQIPRKNKADKKLSSVQRENYQEKVLKIQVSNVLFERDPLICLENCTCSKKENCAVKSYMKFGILNGCIFSYEFWYLMWVNFQGL